jgi:prepilin-type N-terminal cleavage/methylation domain-containing protein
MRQHTKSYGFSLVELMLAIAIAGVLSIVIFTFFSGTFNQYIRLQKESDAQTELAQQSQRLAKVIRGLTGIISASDNELRAYAYFSPSDAYVSEIRYYKNAAGTILYADVIHMTVRLKWPCAMGS